MKTCQCAFTSIIWRVWFSYCSLRPTCPLLSAKMRSEPASARVPDLPSSRSPSRHRSHPWIPSWPPCCPLGWRCSWRSRSGWSRSSTSRRPAPTAPWGGRSWSGPWLRSGEVGKLVGPALSQWHDMVLWVILGPLRRLAIPLRARRSKFHTENESSFTQRGGSWFQHVSTPWTYVLGNHHPILWLKIEVLFERPTKDIVIHRHHHPSPSKCPKKMPAFARTRYRAGTHGIRFLSLDCGILLPLKVVPFSASRFAIFPVKCGHLMWSVSSWGSFNMIFHFRNMGLFLGLGTAWYGSISHPKSTWDVKYIQ